MLGDMQFKFLGLFHMMRRLLRLFKPSRLISHEHFSMLNLSLMDPQITAPLHPDFSSIFAVI